MRYNIKIKSPSENGGKESFSVETDRVEKMGELLFFYVGDDIILMLNIDCIVAVILER
jgi:hypothetical protein